MSSTSSTVLTSDHIWLDGKLVAWADGQVPVMTHALHYGLGVFEGIRAYATSDGRLAIFDAFCARFEPIVELPPGEHIVLDTTAPLDDTVDELRQRLVD